MRKRPIMRYIILSVLAIVTSATEDNSTTTKTTSLLDFINYMEHEMREPPKGWDARRAYNNPLRPEDDRYINEYAIQDRLEEMSNAEITEQNKSKDSRDNSDRQKFEDRTLETDNVDVTK